MTWLERIPSLLFMNDRSADLDDLDIPGETCQVFFRKERGHGLAKDRPHNQCKLHTVHALMFVNNRETGKSCERG